MSGNRVILSFDVGGSFVKAGLVDVNAGEILGFVDRRPTPPGALPEAALTDVIGQARKLDMDEVRKSIEEQQAKPEQ